MPTYTVHQPPARKGETTSAPERFVFVRDKVGSFDTELVQEWFHAFAMNSGITLHAETLYGTNDHHIAESCFKGLARALRAAVAIDPRAKDEVPSTKGSLGG